MMNLFNAALCGDMCLTLLPSNLSLKREYGVRLTLLGLDLC